MCVYNKPGFPLSQTNSAFALHQNPDFHEWGIATTTTAIYLGTLYTFHTFGTGRGGDRNKQTHAGDKHQKEHKQKSNNKNEYFKKIPK